MLLVGGMAHAQVQTLVITENSSSSLTATLNNGAPQTFVSSGDSWTIPLPGLSQNGLGFWQEPGETAVNSLEVRRIFPNPIPQFFIQSDQPALPNSGLPDGSTDKTHFTLNGAELDVTFTDKGDKPSGVPDAAATLPLLSLSLAGLAILWRKLKR
jgi:hypothetical protein